MKHRWTTSLSLILTRGLSTLFSLSPDRLPSRRGGHPSRSTASAAGRPAGLPRLAGARRGLVRSARVLAAVAWLSLLGALALPVPAQAQTTGICDRTQQVQDEILNRLSGVDDCAAVTVADLATVTSLDLEGKSITSLKAGDFAGLTAVTFIGLESNRVTSLPETVFSGLTALETLNLQDNRLSVLPAEVFSGLTALETLNLQDNRLSVLPAEVFSGLTALETLNLSTGNALSSLPGTVFSGLSSLTTLQLENIGITELSAGLFSGLSKLEGLNLSYNQLTSLPDGLFSGLTSLTQLRLDNNDLNALPDGLFSGLTGLTNLSLGDNPDAGDVLPLTVTVEKVGTGQVRAKVLAGAPSDLVLPVSVENGTLAFGATGLRVAKGSVAGAPVSVIRTGDTGEVTVDLGTPLPSLPTNHYGYEYAKAASGLPATILPDPITPPTVESVAVKSAPQSENGYGRGETIVFTLTFSQKVRVTGQPQPKLAFDLGGSTREARFEGMSDTDFGGDQRPEARRVGVKVHFFYTVQPGDRDGDGIEVGALASAIDLGGARIQRAADLVYADGHKVDGVDADLTHAALGRLRDHKVDGGTAQLPAGSGITIIDTHGNPLANNRLTIRESSRGRYGFKLNTRPTHTVRVVAIASDGDPDLQVLPSANAEWAIAPDEWETPFYVKLRAALDDDDEHGDRVFLNRAYSKDPAYNDLILPDVVVVEEDSDAADEGLASSSAQAEAADEEEETTTDAAGPALTARAHSRCGSPSVRRLRSATRRSATTAWG